LGLVDSSLYPDRRVAVSYPWIFHSGLYGGWSGDRYFQGKILVRLALSQRKFMGSAFEPGQFQEEDSLHLSRPEIQNFCDAGFNNSAADPASKAMAQY
jgi:hypothetical protein